MKLSQKEIFQILCVAAIELPLEILSFFIVPVALLFCSKKDTRLPKWAAWFDDPDYGINGDPGWVRSHYPKPSNTTYRARVRWLYRNRIGVFSSHLGVKFSDIDPLTIKYEGDLRAFDTGGRRTGCKITAQTWEGKKYFCIYRSIPYFKKLYYRQFLGHKIQDIAFIVDIEGSKEKIAVMQQFLNDKNNKKIAKTVWSINPFKKIKIKGE